MFSKHSINQKQLTKTLTISRAFTNGMVLQRNHEIKVWGTSKNTEGISVSFGKNRAETHATNGVWEVTLPAMRACKNPKTLSVRTKNEAIFIKDILIGDVYFIGGQSNAEWPLSGTDSFLEDINTFRKTDKIRIFYQTTARTEEIQQNPPGDCHWEPLSADTAGKFSAIGCYFAKTLADNHVNVPIGLIQTALGGTWLQEHVPFHIADAYKFAPSYDKSSQVYNALCAPVEKFAAAGLIWYQGENESIVSLIENTTSYYKKMFAEYVSHLKSLGSKDMKIFLVQLSSHPKALLNDWNVPRMRAFQYDMANNFDHEIYLIPSLDQGCKQADIDSTCNEKKQSIAAHPKYKKVIGQRLADVALYVIYKKTMKRNVLAPKCKNVIYEKNQVTIQFMNTGTGLALAAGSGNVLQGFELTKDHTAYPATASIINKNTIIVKGLSDATGVRYGFYASASKMAANLVNSNNLPCPTFVDGVDVMSIDALSPGIIE